MQERRRTLRVQGPSGKLVNILNDRAGRRTVKRLPEPAHEDPTTRDGRLSEDEVKRAVAGHLKSEGWTVQVAWDRAPGIDFEPAAVQASEVERTTRDGQWAR